MGLESMVGGRVGQLLNGGSNGKGSSRSKFERTLRTEDFFTEDTETLPSDKYSQLGTFTVSAQLEATVGIGDASLDPMEQGRPKFDVQASDESEQDGFVKITHSNATGNVEDTVIEKRTEEFRVEQRSERIVMPRATAKQGVDRLKQDEQIGIYFKPDNSTEVSAQHSVLELPVTFYELR